MLKEVIIFFQRKASLTPGQNIIIKKSNDDLAKRNTNLEKYHYQ